MSDKALKSPCRERSWRCPLSHPTSGADMSKYMWKVNYSAAGMKGVVAEGGNARRNAAEKAVQSVGGHLDSFYFAFGDADLFCIVDFPDAVACAGAAMKV